MYQNALFELSMLDGCFSENNYKKCESVDVSYGFICLLFVLIVQYVLLLSQLW
jgi:hypothetical protein